MKHRKNRTVTPKGKGVTKGAPSGVVISLLIHAAAFFIAGMFVVFKVYNKPEPAFEPVPAVERPKMPIKKPQVKVKSPSKPRSTPIRSKSMVGTPTIDIPDMGGMGLGINTDLGGLDLLPDMENLSVLGQQQSIGNDFEGHLYNLQKRKNGRLAIMNSQQFLETLQKFCQSGWKESVLAPYWRTPTKLYTTHFMVPPIISEMFPDAFGVENMPAYWCFVKYKGNLVYKENIRFRFWGAGDAFLLVRVGGETVLVALNNNEHVNRTFDPFKPARPNSTKDGRYLLGSERMVAGEWIELKSGIPQEMELFFGEYLGGASMAALVVEIEGVEYPKSRQGGPLFPAFKTEEFSLSQLDAIRELLPAGECSLTTGPVFRDY